MRFLRALGLTLGGAGLTLLGARLGLGHQARLARKRIGKALGEETLDADRVWQRRLGGKPLRLLVAGDSLAASLGAARRKDTLGGRLARRLAQRVRVPVELQTVAQVGAESADLAEQLAGIDERNAPDLAVIVVGGNDVTHRVAVTDAVSDLEDAIILLRSYGAAVIVGTCPDLRTLRPVPQPLRSLVSGMSRQLARAQAQAAARVGATAVDLRRSLGPIFLAEPEEMFSIDRFHPSSAGYRRMADALLPALVAAARGRRR